MAITNFMGEVDKISSIGDLNARLQECVKPLGVCHLLCISAFGMPAMQNRKPMFGFRDTDWVKRYRNMNYHIDDALPQYALKLRHWEKPFWWTDFVANNELTQTQRKIFSEAYSYGLKEGIVYGIAVDVDEQDEVTEFAYVSVAGGFSKSEILENTILTVLLGAHRTARRILMREYLSRGKQYIDDPIIRFAPNISRIDSLTPAEIATVKQFAENDTYEQIASAMNCSVSNVKKHIKSAQAKLGLNSPKEMLVALLRHRDIIYNQWL